MTVRVRSRPRVGVGRSFTAEQLKGTERFVKFILQKQGPLPGWSCIDMVRNIYRFKHKIRISFAQVEIAMRRLVASGDILHDASTDRFALVLFKKTP